MQTETGLATVRPENNRQKYNVRYSTRSQHLEWKVNNVAPAQSWQSECTDSKSALPLHSVTRHVVHAINQMENTEYSDKEAIKVTKDNWREKIHLPLDIPWEAGSNRYATQTGMGAFGTVRNTTLRIQSTRRLSESSDGVVPQLSLRKQQGIGCLPALGMRRDNVGHVHYREDMEDGLDPSSNQFLSRWAQPNPAVKDGNSRIGQPRQAKTAIRGLTEGRDRESDDVIPILQRPTSVGGAAPTGFHAHRQVMTKVDGLDLADEDVYRSKKIVPWLTGPQIMQTQSRTGGFMKIRDPVNQTYGYDKE